jgi:crotonobetainyl-CoA:carnitine CoA-transferase CaiB-like acyl-CoA transferase
MGYGDDALRVINDRLVHLAISGYGPDGPDAAKPGYDFVLQAVAGLMSITGFSDDDGGRPTKVGVAIADVVTGLFGAVGVLSALLARRRTGTANDGPGQRVDVSILESTLAVLVNQAQNAFVTGLAPARRGNAHPNIVPYETFATANGEIAVAAGSERQWRRLCDALGVPELAADPRFATNGRRVANRDILRPLLAERFESATSADWLGRLDAAEVPCGPIRDLVEAFEAPQARARRMRVELDHPRLGRIDQVGSAVSLSATPATIRRPPPLLGEHADEILDELGFSEADVRRFRDRRVI